MSLLGLRMAREILQQPALRPFLMTVRHPAPELTTDDQLALAIDPASLALKEGGKVLKPETIHLALRKLAGRQFVRVHTSKQ